MIDDSMTIGIKAPRPAPSFRRNRRRGQFGSLAAAPSTVRSSNHTILLTQALAQFEF